jgi:hypothetical protein
MAALAPREPLLQPFANGFKTLPTDFVNGFFADRFLLTDL